MANIGKGPLGSLSNPGLCDAGTLARTHNSTAAPLCASKPSSTQIDRYAIQLAHRLETAVTAIDTRSAIGNLLGSQCFTAGVIAGMAKTLIVDIYELLKLFKMLALAEYHETKHHPGFWEKLGNSVLLTTGPGAALFQTMAVVDHFWGDFDRLAAQAFEERKELLKLLAAAFDNPGKVFDSFKAAQKANYEKFMKHAASHSLVGSFNAGMLFGELLFDVLLIIDGVTALVKIAAKTPALLRLMPKLEELAPALRRRVEQASRVAKNGGRAPRPVARPRTADRAPSKPASPQEIAPTGGDGHGSARVKGNENATIRQTPPRPDKLVGDQSDPRAGLNGRGGKHTSGKLTPENGGTGDYDADLQTLTGGTRPAIPGDKAPPGSQIGENGIFGRDPNSTGGKSIDIPANGAKPHETLHY